MTEIKVPQLPESITDATLVAWHKKPGDAVKRDENLADLETDKVVLEVPAPANGVLREVKVQTGTVVKAGQLLALFEEGAQAVASAATAAKEAASAEEFKATGTDAGKEKLSPSVRRLIEENRLDAASIPASGRDGRLTKSDVVDFLGRKSNVAPGASPAASTAAPAAVASAAASAARAPTLAAPVLPAASARGEQRVPMTRLRQRIAQRLIEAQSTQALLTSFNEVDLTAVQELRTRYKDRFEKENGVKLGFMSFFVKASIEALKKFPVVNASVDGSDILYHEFYDIGVAVSTERGLVVPIVRDADLKSFATLEKEIGEYAKKARSGGLAIEDLTGGTFTITNGGVFGSLMSTPIVNAPQSAILGMHKIQERPMVVDGQIAIRPMMYIAITYDHRIIDGREAVQFLVTVKDCLEDPGRMLLGI
ncbi:MAG TPA: 2-oxoglutarate dehydrogenase complex dihydrolipoyllysine-residue succinyltransferase [Steroidobacteraceae bacterium]|jgi:2-oxoglutarate dehydrogenase E2 component (dihydrolipoamide succinyltransferase)|nr:2-oxoglutarate dehydrogenase complex dihydrolipoyllysine-residue succinyltransferase [Steroidobacteraceae bacterium]